MAACEGTLQLAQQGLLMRAVFGQVWTIHLSNREDVTARDQLRTAIQHLDHEIAEWNRKEIKKNKSNSKKEEEYRYSLIVAIDPELWEEWTGEHFEIHKEVLDGSTKVSDTGGDAMLYVKGPSPKEVNAVLDTVRQQIEDIATIDIVEAGKRKDCQIIGGRYLDSISNPNDPINLTEDILISTEGLAQGGCFGFTQKFEFKWNEIASQTPDSQDEMVGRNSDDVIIPQHIAMGHIHRAHIYDENRDQRKLLRQALAYGVSEGHQGREKGIMFVAFCNDQDRFEKILKKLLGHDKGTPTDRLMQTVKGQGGHYWYVPPAKRLSVTPVSGPEDVYEDGHWKARSKNGYMFYNSQDYLHQMGEGKYIGGDPPSPRLMSLLSRTFNHWRDGWLHRQRFPRLPHLESLRETIATVCDKVDKIDALPACFSRLRNMSEKELFSQPVSIRKGVANWITLANLLSSPETKVPDGLEKDSAIAYKNNLLRIEPRELIVGVIPDFTLGRGKEVVPYLNKNETIKAWLNGELNEWSAMGHVVPDYELLVSKGLKNMIDDIEARLYSPESIIESKKEFYQSVIISLRGVQDYLRNWSEIAHNTAEDAVKNAKTPGSRFRPEDVENMRDVSRRMARLATERPKDFQDAVQLIYSFHCCLHLVGELTSFGRLDQILEPFRQSDIDLKPERAQEIMDCLWIKIGENAFVDRHNIYDYVTYGTTSVCGIGGNFPQGGGINQWVQQITVGGYKAQNDDKPEGGVNAVTLMCLKSARRMPVNAPTLSLRVYKDMPSEYLDEAAKSILAGGAQPILYNDDKLCEGLFRSGEKKNNKTGKTTNIVDRAWSRNYAADGCYEPMLAGASEFAFNNVNPLLALEQTINQGATYGAAGPEQLRGLKQTFRSPPASEIKTFEQLKGIFFEQLEWLVIGCYNLMLENYGALATVCPSPLLSPLIQDCIEKGLDHTNGGAKFHIIAPLCVGLSNTIDSLYAIKQLVYDDDSAVTTLPELVNCLINDWGFNMQEPFQDHQTLGPADSAERGLRYQELRDLAMSLPKWGSGDEKVNELGEEIMKETVRLCNVVINEIETHPALGDALNKIKGTHGQGFEFLVTPGIGTFEGYVGDGIPCGASADGRRSGMPIASDLSPVPAAQDLPAKPAFRNIYQAMKSVKNDAAEHGLSNASPVDMNIDENFSLEELQKFVRKYADGEVGGNLITLTCADLATYQSASKDPEKYNLVRVRMGGWTEFYATMFQAHQDQHQRRQYFTPKEVVSNGASNGVSE